MYLKSTRFFHNQGFDKPNNVVLDIHKIGMSNRSAQIIRPYPSVFHLSRKKEPDDPRETLWAERNGSSNHGRGWRQSSRLWPLFFSSKSNHNKPHKIFLSGKNSIRQANWFPDDTSLQLNQDTPKPFMHWHQLPEKLGWSSQKYGYSTKERKRV